MWENAAPQSESQKPPPPRPACENGGDTLLWGQMLFCTVVLLVALAARMMGLPFYPELRRTFAQAMQPEQDFFLSTERYFSKFTEKAAAAIAQALPATSETAHQQVGAGKPVAAVAVLPRRLHVQKHRAAGQQVCQRPGGGQPQFFFGCHRHAAKL